MLPDYRTTIMDGPGYWTGSLLSKDELRELRSIVLGQLLDQIKVLAPEHLKRFRTAGLEGYHTVSHLINHASAWPRNARELRPDAVRYLEESDFLASLRDAFGGGRISNEGHGLGPEVVWRIVRPHEMGDVQSLHADSWFWDINNLPYPNHCTCIKVWILLQGSPGESGLRVEPLSHRVKNWNFDVVPSHDYKKPLFDEKRAGLEPILLDTPAGHGVIFSYDLLHGGAPTRGDISRVSMEFTLIVPTA